MKTLYTTKLVVEEESRVTGKTLKTAYNIFLVYDNLEDASKRYDTMKAKLKSLANENNASYGDCGVTGKRRNAASCELLVQHQLKDDGPVASNRNTIGRDSTTQIPISRQEIRRLDRSKPDYSVYEFIEEFQHGLPLGGD